MGWKIEKWFADVFPGEDRIYSEYCHLPPRELAIVSAAVFDLALAELIALKLRDIPKESEGFLGLNDDGRAPAASFGARIQLALLLGLITERDAAILRTIKDIRNKFAHRVKVDFLSPHIQKPLQKLYLLWVENTQVLINKNLLASSASLEELGKYQDKLNEAGEGLLLAIFTVYQAYFHRLRGRITRLSSTLVPTQTESAPGAKH